MKKSFLLICLGFVSLSILGQTSEQQMDSILLGHYLYPDKGKEYRLHPEAEKAFEKMRSAALQDGIDIEVVSSFRSYAAQKRIWNRKFKRFTSEGISAKDAINKIIEYSTLPGTSRHHWGTDIDLILRHSNVKGDVLLDSLFHKNNAFSTLRQWMERHASDYGFHLVYDQDSLRKGFRYEPWHYSYKKLSKVYLSKYIQKRMLMKIKNDSTVLGYQIMDRLFMDQYEKEQILGIHPLLQPED